MVAAAMADSGVRIEHPNRVKAASKITRLIVFVLLIASAVLMAIISWGGWDTIEGAKAIQVGYIVIYLVMAYFVLRWSRGVLPVASALAIILLIFAAVSAPQWFDRDKEGFANPTLDEGILGLLTALVVPVQMLLIAFAMSGFRQAWNVEVERPAGDRPRDDRREPGDASPQPA
jgi:amino acid transporter